MEDLEITTLPVADCCDLPKLRTLGYDDEGNSAQVRLSDLLPQQIQAASIDFMNGLYIARQPFVPGTSEVYVNGLRYTLGKDYKELVNDNAADGFELPGIESSDEIILKAVVITN